MPSSARVYSRLQVLLQDSDAGLDDVVDLVRVDAGLASGVVKVANSVLFRRSSSVESVHEAINRVGLREVNRIVGVSVATQMFTGDLPLYRITAILLWENSLATALAMGILARTVAEDERQAYTVGLLRPVGSVALQRLFNSDKEASARPAADVPGFDESVWEKAFFGNTHAEVSAALMAVWGFEHSVCDAVKYHRKPAGRSRLAALLNTACGVVETLGKGLPGEAGSWRTGDAVLAQAGLSAEVVQECVLETRSELNRWGGIVRGG